MTAFFKKLFSTTAFLRNASSERRSDLETLTKELEKIIKTRSAELQITETRFRLATEAAHVGVWEFSHTTGQIWRNQCHDQLFGYGQPLPLWDVEVFLNHVHPEDRGLVREQMQKAKTEIGKFNFELRVVWPDETVHWMAVTGSTVLDADGKPDHTAGTISEITSLRLYEDEKTRLLNQSQKDLKQLKEEREIREKFVSMLTHDLKSPLNMITISAQLLLRADDTESTGKLLGMIVSGTERIDKMITDLLDANRIQAGEKIPVRIVPCELRSMTHDCVDALKTLHGDRFVVEASSEIQGHWDPLSLRRVIENLISNALKYGAHDTPVTLRLTCSEKRVKVQVHNLGNPIPFEDHKKVFEPFHRSTSADRGPQLGWGIGLTLVRGVVEAHGGEVTMESDALTGTTFTIELPLDARASPAEN